MRNYSSAMSLYLALQASRITRLTKMIDVRISMVTNILWGLKLKLPVIARFLTSQGDVCRSERFL